MAFLRVENKKSGSYIRIVESYRDAYGHSRHRILYNLGKVSDYTADQLQRIGSRLYELGGGDLKDLLGITTREKARLNYGFYQVYAEALHITACRVFLIGSAININSNLIFRMPLC